MAVRVTVTLDDDIAFQLRQLAKMKELPLRDVVNEALRAGLRKPRVNVSPRRYQIKPVALGQPCTGEDLRKALALADDLHDGLLTRVLADKS